MTEWQRQGGGLRSRLWDWLGLGAALERYGVLPGSPAWATSEGDAARQSEYALRAAYYDNRRLYHVLKAAGFPPSGVSTTAVPPSANWTPPPVEWNPVPAVVAFYVATVLAGELDITPGEQAADGDALRAAIDQVWQWSNMASLCGRLAETAAVFGDVFLKVAERAPVKDGPTTGVYMQSIPPEQVRWWSGDERDFLTGIRIDTPRLTSIFSGEARRHVLVEVWRKTWPDSEPGGVRYYEAQPGAPVEDSRLPAPVRVFTFDDLGYDFIPVVWGESEVHWRRMTDMIDRYNVLADVAQRRNMPLGILTAGADGRPAPDVDLGEMQNAYHVAGDGAVGIMSLPGLTGFTWSPPSADLGAMNARLEELRQSTIDALPEYRVATLRGIQIATETMQLLLSQAEQRVLAVRRVLERLFARSQMMALTIGQLADLPGFDAAGIGTFESGAFEHTFTARPVFVFKDALQRETEKAALLESYGRAGLAVEGAVALPALGYSEEEQQRLLQVDAVNGVAQ